MKKVGVGVDYSNICKDYNTAYLDRDNKDPQTAKCMKQVVAWTTKLLTELLEHFDYQIHPLNSDITVKIEDVAANRFLFYSLEKEITLQSFVIEKNGVAYDSLTAWEHQEDDTILVQNDEDGEGIYFYFNEGSQEQQWIMEKLQNFSIDEIPFQAK